MRFLKSLSGLLSFTLLLQSFAWANPALLSSPSFSKPLYEYNHYVIITDVQNDRITYIDPGIGKDKKNESLTVSKEGFLKVWEGYVTLESSLIRTAQLENSWQHLKKLNEAGKPLIAETTRTETLAGSSIKFDGRGDYLALSDNSDWNITGIDFTIDFWVNLKETPSNRDGWIGQRSDGNNGWAFYLDNSNKIIFRYFLGGGIEADLYWNWTPVVNQWTHIAFVRQGNNWTVYANGQSLGVQSSQKTLVDFSNELWIGRNIWANDYYLNGRIDGLRFSKGIARYTENFTPSTERFTADSHAKLLLYSDSQGIKDLSLAPHSIAVRGDAQVDASTYAQSIKKITIQKIITQYPSSVQIPSSLTPEQIQDILQNPDKYGERITAHIQNGRPITLTQVNDDSVTYLDNNEEITLSKNAFLNIWDEDATAETLSIRESNPKESNIKLLSAQEAQNIRGAGLGSWLNFAGDILFFIPGLQWLAVGFKIAAIGVSIAEGDYATAVKATFTQGSIQSIISELSGIAHSLFPKVYESVAGFITKNVFAFYPGLAMVFKAFDLPTDVVTDFITDVITSRDPAAYVTESILIRIGVSPQTAQIVGSTVSMSAQQSFGPQGFDFEKFTSSALTLGTQTALESAGLDPNLSRSISLFAGQSVDGIYSGTFNDSFVSFATDLGKQAAFYGLDRLGQSLGLPTALSSSLGTSLSTFLGTNFQNAKLFGENLIQNIGQSLQQGIVNYGLNFLGNSHPILGSLLSPDIQRSIEQTIGREGLFQGTFNILGKLTNGAFNILGNIGQTFQSFGEIISKQGIAGAFESFATNIFSQPTLEKVFSRGGFGEVLNNQKQTTTLRNGQSADLLSIDSRNGLLFNNETKLIGILKDDTYQIGDFGIGPDNSFSLTNGNIFSSLSFPPDKRFRGQAPSLGGNLSLSAQLTDGRYTDIRIDGLSGETLLDIDPEKPGQSIFIEGPTKENPSFNLWNAVVNLAGQGLKFFISEGVAHAGEIIGNFPSPINSATGRLLYALVNGVNQDPKEGPVPAILKNLKQDLIEQSQRQILDSDVIPVSIFPGGNIVTDIVKWIFEAQSTQKKGIETIRLEAQLDSSLTQTPDRPIVAMAYSGGLLPLMEAATDKTKNYNIQSIVGLGAATTLLWNLPASLINEILALASQGAYGLIKEIIERNPAGLPSLAGTKVQQVVNVWGTKDDLYQAGIAGKRSNTTFGLENPTWVKNIEISGATHFDYMRRTYTAKDTEADKTWNKKVAEFVTRLMINSDTQDRLEAFLDDVNNYAEFNPLRQVYEVKLPGYDTRP